MKYCMQCGTGNNDEARFCTKCGEALDPSEQAPESNREPLDSSEQQPQPSSPPDESVQQLSPAETATMPLQTVADTADTADTSHAQSSVVNHQGSPGGARAMGRAPIIAAVVTVVAILIGTGTIVTYNRGLWGDTTSSGDSVSTNVSPTPTDLEEDDSTSTSTQTPSESTEAEALLDRSALDAIVDANSTTSAAVAVQIVNNTDGYASRLASQRFVAAGMYLPVYLAAEGSNNAQALGDARTMMTNMDNEAGNGAIDELGGLGAVNNWANSSGYADTRLERNFGDVQAADAGYENMTSAQNAADILAQFASGGDTSLMNFDLASEGVVIPDGVNVHAHRGMGIKNAYNYFIIMSQGDKSAAVAVMTQDEGKERAAALASQVMAEVRRTALKD